METTATYGNLYDKGLTRLNNRTSGFGEELTAQKSLEAFKLGTTLWQMDSPIFKECYEILTHYASTTPDAILYLNGAYEQDVVFHCMNWKVAIRKNELHPLFQEIFNGLNSDVYVR